VVGKLHFRSGADDNGFRRVIYTSDHGEALGAQGLLGKFQLYEPSVGVPLILAGPDVPTGMVIEEPVSHIDLYPTILDSFGIDADNVPHPQSLWPMIGRGPRPGPVFAEYHAAGSHAEIFLLRKGDEKILSRHVAEIDPPREDRATGRLLRPRGEQPCPMTALR
jgi:choline-sulfatase